MYLYCDVNIHNLAHFAATNIKLCHDTKKHYIDDDVRNVTNVDETSLTVRSARRL